MSWDSRQRIIDNGEELNIILLRYYEASAFVPRLRHAIREGAMELIDDKHVVLRRVYLMLPSLFVAESLERLHDNFEFLARLPQCCGIRLLEEQSVQPEQLPTHRVGLAQGARLVR